MPGGARRGERQEGGEAQLRGDRLKDRLDALRRQVRDLKVMEVELAQAPDGQISLTDPDARAMATHGKGAGMVGYNVQAVVDAEHHLVVAHEVTNQGRDRSQRANMSAGAKAAKGTDALTVLADHRGYAAKARPRSQAMCIRRQTVEHVFRNPEGLDGSHPLQDPTDG